MSLLDQLWRNLDNTALNVLWQLWFWSKLNTLKLDTLKAMVSVNHETWIDTLSWKSKTIFDTLVKKIDSLTIWWTDEEFLNRIINSWLYQVCKEAWSFSEDGSFLELLGKMINDLVNGKRNDAMNPNQLQWWAIVEVSWRPQAKYIGSDEKPTYYLESAINFMKWCAEQVNIAQWYSVSDTIMISTESTESTGAIIWSLNNNPNITDLTKLPQNT